MVNNVYVSAVTTDNVSRHELLAWVNDLLKASLSKIEEMSTGAAYCQLTHLLFRDNISLKKVKWNSKNEVDHINNWKVLQTAWKEIGVDKPVRVENLMKAKFQDNYEFLQWFYKFFNANYSGEDYDALGARSGEAFPAGGKGAPRGVVSRPAPMRAAPAARPAPTRAAPPAAKPAAAAAVSNGAAKVDTSMSQKYEEEIALLQQQLQELSENFQTVERERLFYFNKLRLVEDLCNLAVEESQKPDPQEILNILYETEDGALPEGEGEAAATDEDLVDKANAVDLDDSETF